MQTCVVGGWLATKAPIAAAEAFGAGAWPVLARMRCPRRPGPRRRCRRRGRSGRALSWAVRHQWWVCGACRRRYARRWPASSAAGSIFGSPLRVTGVSSARMRRRGRSARWTMAPASTARYGRPMEPRRLQLLRVGSRITRAGDVLIPAVLAGMSLTEIWMERFVAPPGVHGPRGLQTAGALLMTLSLGWRRRYPVAVLACVTIGAAVEWPWEGVHDQLSVEAWLAVLLAYYSVGAHVEPRRGLRAIAIGMVPLLVLDVTSAIDRQHTAVSGG